MLNLDVVFDIPNGYLMKIYPRSSTYNKYKVLLTNSVGIIDSTYKGDNDTIKAVLFATNPTSINAGTRILQFELVLSQKATLWQKIKWFFSSSVKLERVPNFVSFTDKNRGGYGSTGI
jgi:dUTP pyrophosphatase